MTIRHVTWARNWCAIFVVVLAIPAWLSAQTSPDNSRIPPLTSLKAADGGIFTMVNGTDVYRDGVTQYGSGSELLIKAGIIYVKGDDAFWYQYTPANGGWPWTKLTLTDPCATGCAPVVVIPPVIVPITNVSKLSWDMNNTTTIVVAGGSFKLYVDALAGTVLAGRTCVAAGANVTCTSPLPTLAIGQHTMTISWVDALKKESTKSNQITVAIGAILLAPTNLTAK